MIPKNLSTLSPMTTENGQRVNLHCLHSCKKEEQGAGIRRLVDGIVTQLSSLPVGALATSITGKTERLGFVDTLPAKGFA